MPIGVGTGEAINEAHSFKRMAKMAKKGIDRLSKQSSLMKRMWESEEYFNHQGKYFKNEKLLPLHKAQNHIPIYFAAQGRKAASYSGFTGDHLCNSKLTRDLQRRDFPTFENLQKKWERTHQRWRKWSKSPSTSPIRTRELKKSEGQEKPDFSHDKLF